MFRTILIYITLFLISFLASSQENEHQKKFDLHIKKYRDSIFQTNDTLIQKAIFQRFWSKHMKYIQDTFKMGFPKIDTFEFKKLTVKSSIDRKKNKEKLDYFFDNEIYFGQLSILFPNNKKTNSIFDLYRISKKLEDGKRVKALIQIENLSFLGRDYKTLISSIYLNFELKSIIILDK